VASRALKSGDVVDGSAGSLIRSLSPTTKLRQIQSWKMLFAAGCVEAKL
jgi:hypothetical protein